MIQIAKRSVVLTFPLKIEKFLEPFWNLITRNKNFNEISKICKKIYNGIEIPQKKGEEEEILINSIYRNLCSSFFDRILSMKNLEKKKFPSTLFIIKSDNNLTFCEDGKNGQSNNNEIINIFSSYRMLEKFISPVDKTLYECIKDLENPKIYNQLFNDDDDDTVRNIVTSIVFKKDLLNTADIKLIEFESNNILWFNKRKLHDIYHVDIEDIDKSYLIYGKDISNSIGLIINGIVFPLHDDIFKYIDSDRKNEYYWNLISSNVYNYDDNDRHLMNEDKDLIDKFFETCKTDYKFINILAKLKNNLYLESSTKLEESYSAFFNSILKLDGFEVQLNDVELFVNSNDNENTTLLGIYNKFKIPGDTKYQLQHLYEIQNNDIQKWESVRNQPDKITKNCVSILKAKVAFYMIDLFYEDYINSVLHDLYNDRKIEGFVRNYKIQLNSENKARREVDFIVYKNQNFYFIEAKTTLCAKNVSDYIEKYCDLYANLFEISSNVKFILCGFLSYPDIQMFQFSQPLENNDYNKERSGLANTPYSFSVPIKETGQNIICFTEPYYDKLKKMLESIFS